MHTKEKNVWIVVGDYVHRGRKSTSFTLAVADTDLEAIAKFTEQHRKTMRGVYPDDPESEILDVRPGRITNHFHKIAAELGLS